MHRRNTYQLFQGIVNVTDCPTEPVMDVVFIVDSSSSIGADNFELMRQFIINLIEVFQVSPSTTQVRCMVDRWPNKGVLNKIQKISLSGGLNIYIYIFKGPLFQNFSKGHHATLMSI